MTEKSPAFQFYPKDWLSDARVRAMGREARGVYIDLLAIYWNEGGLSSNTEELARVTVTPQRTFDRLWPLIAPCFGMDGNSLRSKRLDKEQAKQSAYKASQALKGQKSAKARSSNKENQPRLESGSTPVEPRLEPKSKFPFASPTTTPEQPPSSPSVDSRSADDARGHLRDALQGLRQRQHAFAEKPDQGILDCPVFHAPTGPVRIDSCANVGLLLATAWKVRAYGQPKPSKPPKPRKGDPWGGEPDESQAMLEFRAAEWLQGFTPPISSLDLRAIASGAPDDIRGAVTMILFARNPHLREPAQTRQTQTQEMQP